MTLDLATKADIAAMQAKIEDLERVVGVLVELSDTTRTITPAQIAKREGVSVRSLDGAMQYLLPRFGVSGFPDGKRRWTVEEYASWSARDPKARKTEWLAHLEQVRKAEVKAARK